MFFQRFFVSKIYKMTKLPLSQKLSIERKSVFQVIRQLAADNQRYFDGGTWSFSWSYAPRFCQCCKDIENLSYDVQALVDRVQTVAPQYDYDSNTPGNGLRSLVCVVDTCVLHLVRLFRQINEQRGSLMFRSAHYCKELEAYAAILRFFNDALTQIALHVSNLDQHELFPFNNMEEKKGHYVNLMKKIEQLDTSCFYGRALGFQFASSVWRVFQVIGVVLATYSVSWEEGKGLSSWLTSGKLLLSPEQRARRIIKVTREADIGFCKGFWGLAEGRPAMLPNTWFGPQLSMNEVLQIDSDSPLYLETNDGNKVLIPKPDAHTGLRPVPVRLLTASLREGMRQKYGDRKPASPYLVIHCHGGGYVATSSKSHEPYLRHWAKHMDCPILSIDYSLSPENPFPRPTQEMIYAYAYAINNPQRFGWTGEKVVFTGDSAGGNLITSVTIRLIDLNVKRLPDGLVPIYTPFLFQYLPSPSRLLSLMDPLLHTGIVLRCVAAYMGALDEVDPNAVSNDRKETDLSPHETTHKTLQDYVEAVNKSRQKPLIDWGGENSDVLSLVNLDNDDQSVPNEPYSSDDDNEGVMFNVGDEDDEERPRADSDLVDVDDSAEAKVEIHKDPARIFLTTSLYDHQLLDYLSSHPLTKDSLILCDKDGENQQTHSPLTKTEGIEAFSEEQWETKRKLERSQSYCENKPARKRSLSQLFGDAAVMATSHAFDNISGFFDEKPDARRNSYSSANLRKSSLSSFGSPAASFQLDDELDEPFDDDDEMEGILSRLQKMPIPKNPEISPMFASNEQLSKFPPISFVACHMDPLLDDTIAFARKVRASGGIVKNLDLLDSLPHGFLNFTVYSPECRDAAKLVMLRLEQRLGMV